MRCHHTCYFAICFFGILFIPTNKTGTGVSNNCALFCCVTTVRLICRGKSPERFPGGFHALPVANQAAADAALCAAALCPCPPELAGPPPSSFSKPSTWHTFSLVHLSVLLCSYMWASVPGGFSRLPGWGCDPYGRGLGRSDRHLVLVPCCKSYAA